MARTKLTAGRVAAFTSHGKGQAFLWDDAAPGLALRVTASGSKAFIFQTEYAGKTLRLTIGAPESWSIPEARTEARRLQMLVDKGADPRAEKAATIAQAQADREAAAVVRARDSVTVGEAWAVYLEARRPKWSPRSYLNHTRMAAPGGEQRQRGAGKTVAAPLAVLLPLRLSELNADVLAAWLDREAAERPTAASSAFRLVRGFIRWAGEHPEYRALIAADAYRSKAVAEAVPPSKAKEGDCLQREQLPLWFDAVRKLANPVHAAYLQTAILTGARREEIAGMRWEDVDFRWGSITIADKVEGARVIPLTPYVSRLLAALPRRNEWVFSSPTAADGRLKEPRMGHERALAAAGLPHLSIHGLRRSFGTLAEWVEVPAGVVAQLMGHRPSATAERHYRRRPLDLLRMWHIRIETWVLKEAGLEQPAEHSEPVRLRAV